MVALYQEKKKKYAKNKISKCCIYCDHGIPVLPGGTLPAGVFRGPAGAENLPDNFCCLVIDTKRDVCYTVITYLGKFLAVRSLNPHMRKQKIWRREWERACSSFDGASSILLCHQ